MTTRRPLVNVAGAVKELPAGDALPAQTVYVQQTAPVTTEDHYIWVETRANGDLLFWVESP